jgi:hypothetical protein
MEKLSHSNGDGSTMSRKPAPHLIHADAQAPKKKGYGGSGGGKPPANKYHAGGIEEPDDPKLPYGHNAPINKTATPKKEPYNPQAKLWDDKKSDSRPKASGSDNKPKPNKPNKHTSMPSRPADMPSKKEPYNPQAKIWDDKK